MIRTKQPREWHSLGLALKALREARDLGQKEVIDHAGEEMGERTVRGYERGEQRPSRERLLRLALRSFGLKDPAEINRLLKLGGYASLGEPELLQYDLHPATANGAVATTSAGPPVDFRIEVSTLVVSDGQGREVWRHEFPSRFAQGVYDSRDAIRRCAFADIDGDGDIETLFTHLPSDWGSVGATLMCFAEDGRIKWQFEPGKLVRDTTSREYSPPYFISNVRIIPMRGENPRILVSSNHYLHNPNQIAMLDSAGALMSEYWHSGHLLSVAHGDINGDGIEEVLLAGVNNGYGQATLVIFDSRNISGVSNQPGRQILGFPPGTEKAVVLFPKTCLARTAPYNRVSELRITRERRIMLAVVEGVSEARNPGVMIYELDFALNLLNARPDSHLQEAHRILEMQGALDHPWTEEETARLRRQVIVKGAV